jgi:carbon-monoxide dehydrogenase medium subunit
VVDGVSEPLPQRIVSSYPAAYDAVEKPSNLGPLDRVDLLCPATLPALLSATADGRRPLAGGTDLLVGAVSTGRVKDPLVWTGGVHELLEVEAGPSPRIGAAAPITHIVQSRLLSAAPAVVDGAGILGSIQTRNVATIAGNLCNASPAADTIPGLVVHGARVEVRSAARGIRTLTVPEFVLGPGRTALEPDEVVTHVQLDALEDGEGSCYQRFTVRRSMDLAFVGVAVRLRVDRDSGAITKASIALGAVGPTVQLVDAAAGQLLGQPLTPDAIAAAADAASRLCSPISDVRASADYRRHLVRVLVREAIPVANTRALRSGRSPDG